MCQSPPTIHHFLHSLFKSVHLGATKALADQGPEGDRRRGRRLRNLIAIAATVSAILLINVLHESAAGESQDSSFGYVSAGTDGRAAEVSAQAGGKLRFADNITDDKIISTESTPLASGPGALSFSASSYSVGEAAGNVTITLKRTAGTDNKIVAKVALANLTTTQADYFIPGTLDTSFNYGVDKGADSNVQALALQPDGKVLIGGSFTSYNRDIYASDRILRLNADGSLDTSFNNYGVATTGTDDFVFSIAVQPDGKILIGGRFTSYNGDANASDCVARLNTDGSLDTSFNYGSQTGITGNGDKLFWRVYTLVLQPDGKIIVGGTFTGYNSDSNAGEDVIRLSPDGTLDTSFHKVTKPIASERTFYSAALQPDGKIVIGGSYYEYNHDPFFGNDILRLNADGTLDTSFDGDGGGRAGYVTSVALQPDGKILISGGIDSYNGDANASDMVMRLNADGRLDTSFNYAIHKITSSNINVVAVQPDGKILIGGSFVIYNSDPNTSRYIARLKGDIFVTWEADDASDKVVQIPIADDTLDEGNETLKLSLIPLTGGAGTGTPSAATLTIIDNELTFSQITGRAFIGGPATLTTRLTSGGLPLSGKSVSFSLNGLSVGQATTDASGVATLSNVSIGSTAAGVYPIVRASFAGDETFSAASSSLGALSVIPSNIQLSSASYSIGEGAGRVTITVTRNDATTTASVEYATSDAAGLALCNAGGGNASARCDYTAAGGKLTFAPGEVSKTFTIPIVNDVFVESPETLTVTLSDAVGVTLGAPSLATVTIMDDDTATVFANPIDTRAFFVRQLYLDFLDREPEPSGLSAWLNRLNTCPLPGESLQNCDEIEVASAFFRSPEAFDRSYFIYKFYEASLLRQPQYDEFQNDLRRLTGFLSGEQLEQRKREFAEEFVNRAEFHSLYDSFASGQPFVDAVLARAGGARAGVGAAAIVTANRISVIERLGNGQLTRGQALRELTEAPEINRRFYNKAFVVVGYFSFLRRNPDGAYLHWINVLDTTGDYREMIRGFMQSPEYRSRFGPI
jgi:uncharacterized delta-60 repeat protein